MLAVGIAALGVAGLSPRSTSGAPEAYFLALGDSLVTGFNLESRAEDTACSNSGRNPTGAAGFTCYVWSKLKHTDPGVQLDNLASDGATAAHIVATGDQLTPALDLIKAHPGEVSPILMEIGGNDWGDVGSIPFQQELDSASLEKQQQEAPVVLAASEKSYDTILSKLRAAAPDADILLPSYDDPLSGIPPRSYGPLGEQFEAFAKDFFSQWASFVQDEAERYGAAYVDFVGPFNGLAPQLEDVGPGGFLGGSYGHPNGTGYKLLGDVIWETYQATLAGVPPITVSTSIAFPSVMKYGDRQTFSISTQPGTPVTVTLSWVGGKKTLSGTADASGTYKATWKASASGGITAKMCAARDGLQLCIPDSFAVTGGPPRKSCKKGYKRIHGKCKKVKNG